MTGIFKVLFSLPSPEVLPVCAAGWIACLPLGKAGAGGSCGCHGQILVMKVIWEKWYGVHRKIIYAYECLQVRIFFYLKKFTAINLNEASANWVNTVISVYL